MKKINKYLNFSIALALSSNIFFIQSAGAKGNLSQYQVLNNTFSYPYALSDHLRNLDRYGHSIERIPGSSRWRLVPDNLLMVYLWNKENYHDEELLTLADKWVSLSKGMAVGENSEYRKISNIFANLIKQNFTEAEKTYRSMDKVENPFYAQVAKTLIGTTKKTKASLQGNTFVYDIRVINIEEAEQLVNDWPESALARYILASTLKNKEEQGITNEDAAPDFKETLPEISRAAELAPNNLLYALKKIQVTYDPKNPVLTDEKFNDLFRTSLKDSFVAEEIANFYARNKEISKSISYLNEAVKVDKGRFTLYRKLNSLYNYTGELKPAIDLYEKAITDFPSRIELYEDLAELYQKNKADYKSILNLFKQAVSANPESSKLHLELGDAYFYNKEPENATNEYQAAINLNKSNTEAYGKLLGVYWDKNNMEKVLEYARAAVKNNPDYAMGYLWQGSVYLKQNKTAEAIKVIKESIKINPKFITGYNSLGLAYRAAKNYDLANKQFKQALELNPNYLEALVNIGDTYTQKGDYVMAEKTYSQALKSDPYNEGIYFSMGNLYTEKKDFKKAESAFQKAILINPSSLDSRNNLGNVFLKQEKLNEAIGEFEKVLEINDKYATAYYNIACALSLKKVSTDSLNFLAKAIEMDNSLKEVARNDPDFNNIKNENRFRELTN